MWIHLTTSSVLHPPKSCCRGTSDLATIDLETSAKLWGPCQPVLDHLCALPPKEFQPGQRGQGPTPRHQSKRNQVLVTDESCSWRPRKWSCPFCNGTRACFSSPEINLGKTLSSRLYPASTRCISRPWHPHVKHKMNLPPLGEFGWDIAPF